ncbi:formate dehydrogenase [Campylobacter pinnipediorum subsp. pinnipediorum]|nr:formate dehydrogenase [Campylobacter pinnipediorum subsp. pinnipediorum]
MTNHFGDVTANSKAILLIGANSAVANPIGFKHMLQAKDRNNCKLIVVDPIFTKSAARADHYVRIRPGTDIAFVYGMLHLIFKNGWEDKEYIKDRAYGIDKIREEAKKWTPEETSNVTGVPADQIIQITRLFATTKPATVAWSLGITQHSVGSSNTRILSILQTVLGNMGKPGGGCNIIRGHDNVQGATDMGNLADTLPTYYGLGDKAWKYFCKGWGVDFDEFVKRFAVSTKEKKAGGDAVKGTKFQEYFYHDPKNPEDRNWRNEKGWSLAKWWQGVLKEEKTFSSGELKVLWVQGTGIASMSHLHKIQQAVDKLDLLVIAEPFVNEVAILSDRKDGVYILPVATQFENEGTVVATNRAGQWRSKVVEPLYESKPDHEVMFEFAKKWGFYDEFTKSLKMEVVDGELKVVKDTFVWPDDATNEMARMGKSIGLTGWRAERLRRHQANWQNFDPDTQLGIAGDVKGEYYALPWPCWDEKHSGTPILYRPDVPYIQGGSGFRNRFGLEHDGESLIASEAISIKGAKVKGGYPQITKANIEKVLGIKLTEEEKAKMGEDWMTDYSGIILKKCREAGIAPYGNAKARAIVWEFIDQIPKHREPIHSTRPDLVEKYPTFDDQDRNFRVETKFKSEQTKEDWSKEFPTIMSSMRLVNLSGAGMIERTSKYLSAITPEMFAYVNPELALEYGILDGDMMWIHSPTGTKIKVKCYHNHSVTPDRICLPYNFAGIMQGVDLSARYPEGTKPYTIGESSNTITNYGFDPVTQISEFNAGLCRLEKAEPMGFKTNFLDEIAK